MLFNLVKLMKRRRRKSTSITRKNVRSSNDGNPVSKQPRGRIGASTTDCFDTNETMSSDSEGRNEPWRVEYLQSGPPQDDDWWESDSDLSVEETGVQYLSQAKAQRRTFRNKGRELWEKARGFWSRGNSQASRKVEHVRLYSSTRQQIMRELTQHREFNLPIQLPLSQVIKCYAAHWCGETDF